MPRTFGDLQNEVLSHAFSEDYRPWVKVWLNEAAQEVSRSMRLPAQRTSSSLTLAQNSNSVDLPADTEYVAGVSIGNSSLHEVSTDEIVGLGASRGTPSVYALYGNTLRLYPSADRPLTVLVERQTGLAEMTSDTAAINVPGDFEDLLVSYALYKAFRREDDVQMWTAYKQEFEQGLAKMRSTVQHRSNRVRRVGSVQGAYGPRFIRP